MDPNEKKFKESLVKMRASIKKKYKDLHSQKLTMREELQDFYEPITKPLNKLAKSFGKSESAEEKKSLKKEQVKQKAVKQEEQEEEEQIEQTPEKRKKAESYRMVKLLTMKIMSSWRRVICPLLRT